MLSYILYVEKKNYKIQAKKLLHSFQFIEKFFTETIKALNNKN